MSEVEYRCFVGGLAWATNENSLHEAFSSFGEVLESKIINDRETGRSRGFGFVTFKDEQAMKDAIEGMNGQSLDGRNITVNEAQLKPNTRRFEDKGPKLHSPKLTRFLGHVSSIH
nr:glycine-rich RNA-binding protein-like [Ipomoea trifida]